MSEPYPTGGHITVREDLSPPKLVRVWQLRHFAWAEGGHDLVSCHVADVNDVPKSGVPHQMDRVTVTVKFEDAPEEVQQALSEEARTVWESVKELRSGDSDG